MKHRLDRLARLVVNGVKENDLEPENLDDMMRAAVSLTEWDIEVLGKMGSSQGSLISGRRMSFDWSEQVGHLWTNWNSVFGIGEDQHLRLRSALSRLQSLGLVAEAQTVLLKYGSLARQAFGVLSRERSFTNNSEESRELAKPVTLRRFRRNSEHS